MTELMTKQEAAKELLKPYFDDPSLCSISQDGKSCLYDGPEGRMCAFARACTPEGRNKLEEGAGPEPNLYEFGYNILQEKYPHIEDEDFWVNLQEVHDVLALCGDSVRLQEAITELTNCFDT